MKEEPGRDWCFFRNEACHKLGDFSNSRVAPSKKVFYSYSTKRRDAGIIKKHVERILRNKGFELITFESRVIPSTSYYCENICSLIRESAFVVSDVSPADGVFFPNVVFEVGLAGGCGKPIILVASIDAHSALDRLKEVWPTNLLGVQFFEYPLDFHSVGDSYSEFEKAVVEVEKKLLYIPAFSMIGSVAEINDFHIKLEGLKSERYILGRYPLSIMRTSRMANEVAQQCYGGSFETGDIPGYIDAIEERRRLFDEQLEGGMLCREIYVKNDFLQYFKGGETRTHEDPPVEVNERLQRLKVVCNYGNYEIGLLDMKAPRCFLAKKNYCVYIFSESRYYKSFPGEIISSRNDIVSAHIKFHDELWEQISNKAKDKATIIKEAKDAVASRG
ncbi:MAG: hypothetical protein HY693_00380 [Deltaproteobacteria bacterium]|nr:hypothetical protein [Deltaproteobacteria bacterium]